ncbi:hydrogenase [Nocardioides islandensis]|jgi:hydrogenase-4 component F|uniref:Hydrogenase n=1 Tax=Nocardioides islandensis TaxID=433663 RepID=A0A930VBN6_9ACTN|nr:proton-conducting transporter membrane subunit [Nocardioides islandensis]MBF4764574.1 hydrogenase [Nocardioides islandensis]
MGAVLLLTPGCCLLVALTVAGLRGRGPDVLLCYAGVAGSVVALGSGLTLVVAHLGGHGAAVTTLGGQLRADSLSAFMLTSIGAVGLTATLADAPRRSRPVPSPSYPALVLLFLGAMSVAVLADNLGVLWVAVEATTVATAFLVGHHGSRHALEAAWKYVVLGSVGVAIAFLGIVLLYAATRSAGVATLSWSTLNGTHPALDPSLVRLAAALAILGFATKTGLAPMHSWLPDAHSQAPAPVSGLMSGVLLSVAFYAILRIQAVAAPVIGTTMMRSLLATAGLLSLAVATLLMISQRDLKRLLAYSSVEHVGVLALAASVGGSLAIAAALLHVLGHGLAKATAFVGSGWVLETEGTTRISDLRHLLHRRPGIAIPLLAAVMALLGLPPFSLFFSEVGIVVAGFQRGMGWVMAAMVALLMAAFVALVRRLAPMFLGHRSDDVGSPDRTVPGIVLPLAVALAVTAVAGFAAGPFATLLTDAAAVLSAP